MSKLSSIQWKALVMLVSFSVSFTLFCHCAAMASVAAAPHCIHCHKKTSKKTDAPEGCQGMQAVKFNLLEKQTADHIFPAPAPLTTFIALYGQPINTFLLAQNSTPRQQSWSYKHSPPNILSLHQRFLI